MSVPTLTDENEARELARPNYSEDAKFSFTVTLPLPIARAAEVRRKLTVLNADQELPCAVIDWLASSVRYAHYFAEDAESGSKKETQAKAAQVSTEIDDLTILPGVGRALESTLNELGLYTYADVAHYENLADVKGIGELKRTEIIDAASRLAEG